VVFFSGLSAQELEQLIGRMVPNTVDIRSIGMGKTEVAGKLGSNAIFANPSLLALQEKSSIKLGSSLHFGFMKDEYEDAMSKGENYDSKYGYKPNFKFTNISAALPINIDLTSTPLSFAFGAGYQNAIDLSFTEYYNTEQKSINGNIESESKSKFTGGLNTITPSFAIGVFKRISAGISFNIGFGKVRENFSSIESSTGDDEYGYTGVASVSGFYPTFGLTGRPLANLAIGMSITPPYEWKWDDLELEMDDDVLNSENELEGGEFTIPLKFTIGLEYHATPKFSVAIEYQTRPLESFDLDADRTTDGMNLVADERHLDSLDLTNGHVLHVGTEIIAGTVPVRLGFMIEPYPVTNTVRKNSRIVYDGKPNYLFGGTFGLGIPASDAVFIDFAAQYGFFKTTNVTAVSTTGGTNYKDYDHIDHHLRVDLGVAINLPAIVTKKSVTSKVPQVNSDTQNNSNSSDVMPSQNSQPSYQSNQYIAPNGEVNQSSTNTSSTGTDSSSGR
jgi:hypothetical protein